MNRIIIVSLILFSTINFSRAQDYYDPHHDGKLEAQYKAERLARISEFQNQQTANQDRYDVKHYDLDLTIDVTGKQIRGTVTILSEVVEQAISQMDVNLLSSMTVDAVTVENASASFQHRNDIIQITLNKTYQPGELFRVAITYRGRPQQTGFGAFGFDTYNGQPMIWSLSEPFGARNWWPCKDFPSDKADSADIRVTVPKNLIVASNGNLRSETELGGLKTYWWHESYPIVTYLISVAIYPYYVYSDYYRYSATDSMEVRFYVYPDQINLVRAPYAKVVDMIKIFADIYGEYPFIREKYGHAQFQGGANMEHQTISSMVSRNETTIAHELAHQWWGDYITCENFHEIWLNEGFATYSEALYLERYYGKNEFWQEVESNKYFGGGTVYVYDLSNTSLIFNYNRTYRKASWILHMLRHVVGDENFFKILKEYYNESHLRYGTATTDDFRAVCERVSGINLEKYFYQWLYEEYFPTYSYSWNWKQHGENYDIQLQIDQLQHNQTFWMPIDVTITSAAGETTIVVWDSLPTQTFNLTVQSEPIRIELDKYNWILKQVQEPIVAPTFDTGILLVNGVSWNTYGSEIRNAYQSKAFWGSYPISFWDCFPLPMGGYPATLPAPLGRGKVPADVLGKFSTIIWIGNNYDGDLSPWTETSIFQYLKSGGNLLLMTRMGQNFINADLRAYLGITWAEGAENQINNCIAEYPGLQNMNLTGTQTYNAVFNSNLTTNESSLLFTETTSFAMKRGLGVWRKPANGGTFRADGGRFAYISGRPYRYNSNHLKANVEFILENFFQESKTTDSSQNHNSIPTIYELEQNYPNPFNPGTEIIFQLPENAKIQLEVFDMLGRKMATLVNEYLTAGRYTVTWNADGFASGVYFYRINSTNFTKTRKMVLVR